MPLTPKRSQVLIMHTFLQLDCKPQEFVKGLGLSWPPVFVSVMQKDKGRSKDLNDIDLLQEFVVETARNPYVAQGTLRLEIWRMGQR